MTYVIIGGSVKGHNGYYINALTLHVDRKGGN